MNNQPVGRLRPASFLRAAAILADCVVACCVAACGGEGGGSYVARPIPGPPLSPGYAYIASENRNGPMAAGAIYQYTIAPDGSLSPLAVSSVPTGVDPVSIAADPTGHFVYTANAGDNTISQFAVGTGGSLTPLSPATVSLTGVPSGGGNYSLSVDPASHNLYVVAGSVIDQFSIGADGSLTALSPAYVGLSAFGSASGALAIDPTGANAYLGVIVPTPGCTGCAQLSEVYQFAIGPDGALSSLNTTSATGTVVRIVLAPNGGAAYVLSQCVDSNCDGSIAPYTIASNGALSATGVVSMTAANVRPVDLVVEGSGSSTYADLIANTIALNGDEDVGSVYPYATGSAGALSALSPPIRQSGTTVAESAYGPDLYVLVGPGSICCGNYLAIYATGAQGELTNLSNTQLATSEPTGMVLIGTPQ